MANGNIWNPHTRMYEAIDRNAENLKRGSIRDMDEKDIYCILQQDFELDHELILVRSLLTDRQNKIAALGLIVRYNFDNGVVEFMLKDGNWC